MYYHLFTYIYQICFIIQTKICILRLIKQYVWLKYFVALHSVAIVLKGQKRLSTCIHE